MYVNAVVSNFVLGRRLVQRTEENRRLSHERLCRLEERTESVCSEVLETAKACGVDWATQAEHIAREQAKDPTVDLHLPVKIDGIPAPPLEDSAAERARQIRNVFPHDLPPEE